MVRICPVCKLALRANDPGCSVQVLQEHVQWLGMGAPQGSYSVCHKCFGRMHPEHDFTPHVPFPPPEGLGPYWCAVCKGYAREDDPIKDLNTVVRLLPEDISDPAEDADMRAKLEERAAGGLNDRQLGAWLEEKYGVRHGALRACQECMAKWGPTIHRRLIRDRIIPDNTPIEQVIYNSNLV